MFRNRHFAIFMIVGACGTAHASEWISDFFQIGRPGAETGGICFGMAALSDADFVTSVRYTRGAPESLLDMPGDPVREYQFELVAFQIPPGGAPVSRCFVPSDARASSHRLQILVNGEVQACRGFSRLEFNSAGLTSTSFSLDVGPSAETGATAVLFSVDPASVPAGWSVSVPASVSLPAAGQREIVPVTVNHPFPLSGTQSLVIRATLNSRDHFFHEVEAAIDTTPSVPALPGWGATALLAVMAVAGIRAARKA